MKICSRCNEQKDEAAFNFKNRKLQIREVACKICTRLALREHYYGNREYYLAKAKKRNKKIKIQIKEFIKHYLLSHPCIDCRENDPIVLEFDHIKDKTFTIASLGRNHTLEDVKTEVEKCAVRCANCHRRRTAKQFGWDVNKLPL